MNYGDISRRVACKRGIQLLAGGVAAALLPAPPADAAGATTRFSASDFPLNRVPPLRASNLKPQDLDRVFGAFQHEPFESAGYNTLALPFRYNDQTGGGNSDEANAFAFLLSSSLDWGRGNYCTRHAYFAFKRSRDVLLPYRKDYVRGKLPGILDDWAATHAVGGELVHLDKGYSGTLEIYDRRGRGVLRKTYDEPRPYFDLLGDVASDAIGYLDKRDPSPALVKHLHLTRCQNFESIRLLGSAAFLAEKSDEEFDAYSKILEQDPDFAEVRLWWANQKGWKIGDEKAVNREKGLSLKSYLTAQALHEFKPDPAEDNELAAAYPNWLDQAERLAGKDFPLLLRLRLEETHRADRIDLPLVLRATEVARRYPNDYYLLLQLASTYAGRGGLADLDLSASMWYAAQDNEYLLGAGDKTNRLFNVGADAHDVGRCDLAMQMLGPQPRMKTDQEYMHRFFCLSDAGQFAKALDEYHAMRDANLAPKDGGFGFCVATVAAMAGRLDELDVMRRLHADWFKLNRLNLITDAYAALLEGHDADLGAQVPAAFDRDWRFLPWGVAAGQLDLIHGRTAFQKNFERLMRLGPNERSGWILMDQYERRSPTEVGANFYATMEWLYGDEPTVHQMVADARKRLGSTKPTDVRPLFDLMKADENVRWPSGAKSRALGWRADRNPSGWDVAAGAKQLLKDEPARARELAYRYYSWAMSVDVQGPRIFANHLIHVIDVATETPAR